MSGAALLIGQQRHSAAPPVSGVLQRKCAACGNHTMAGGECQECGKNKLQTKLQVNEPGDVYEQEADRMADQVLAASADAAVRGGTPRIQRFSGQSKGQMDAVPASVDQALASPGRPLEPALREDMELRFGHDFSRVRVHSEAVAAQSAQDVNAHAYTVGSNIVFGAGRFVPGSDAGRRLIAHELTHVVQQSGSNRNHLHPSSDSRRLPPIPTVSSTSHRLSRKAKVELEGWGSELIGHDDSDVTFTPSGSFRTKAFQREMAAASFHEQPNRQMMRMMRAIIAGDWVSSGMEERNGYGGTLRIKAGSKGTVEITVNAHFFFDEKYNSTYDQFFACSWDIEADLKGGLKIYRPRPDITPIGDDEAPFQLSALNPDQDQDAGSVQISPQFTSSQFTDIPNVTIGGGVEGKKGGISGSVVLGNERTFPPGILLKTFFLNLEVIDIPPPEVSVRLTDISQLRKYKVLFPPPKNGKGQDAVSSAQQQDLINWYQGLSDRTKENIDEGAIEISVEGHTSTTGDNAMNLGLSERRKDNVKNILSVFVSNHAKFNFRSTGEYKAKTPDNVESQEERKVVVSVWEAL